MIKDKLVAQRRGGKLFDTVCKFDVAVDGVGCGNSSRNTPFGSEYRL
jgi:hypothetical protein